MVQSKAPTVTEYLRELPRERAAVIRKVRKVIKDNLGKGFQESMNWERPVGNHVRVSVRIAARFCGSIAARERRWSRTTGRSASANILDQCEVDWATMLRNPACRALQVGFRSVAGIVGTGVTPNGCAVTRWFAPTP